MRTFLCWHLGLGDALICCGLVRALVARGAALTLPVQPQYLNSVSDLFQDLIVGGEVRLIKAATDPYEVPNDHGVIRIGNHGKNFDHQRWDVSFYEQAEIAPWAQVQLFKIGRQYEWPKDQNYDRLFVHDDSRFPLSIEGPRPGTTASIFEHLPALLQCEEFHGINSSFAVLLALVGRRGPWRKVLYDIRPEPLPSTFDSSWDIVKP